MKPETKSCDACGREIASKAPLCATCGRDPDIRKRFRKPPDPMLHRWDGKRITLADVAKEREKRTRHLIAELSKYPDGWTMLKGVLCMDHGHMDEAENLTWKAARALFDSQLIAQHLDEVNARYLEKYRREKEDKANAENSNVQA